MSALFASGRIVDAILLLTALEAAGLLWLHHRAGAGVAPADLLPNLLAGASLLLALRAGLAGAWFGWVAAALLAALVFHLADLRRRWRPTAPPPER